MKEQAVMMMKKKKIYINLCVGDKYTYLYIMRMRVYIRKVYRVGGNNIMRVVYVRI